MKINLEKHTEDLIQWHATTTGMTRSEVIGKLLSAHLPELWELRTLIETHPEVREQAANLLISYGPDSIMSGIQRIAPNGYTTLEARFQQSMSDRAANFGGAQ